MAKRSMSTRRAESAAAMKAAEIRKAHERRERRRRSALVTAVILAALALIGGIAFAVYSSRDVTGEFGATPKGVVDDYAIPWGEDAAPVKVVVYEDFLCPFCQKFDAGSAALLEDYVDGGQVQVRYRVVTFLSSLGTYSADAANAHAVVLDQGGQEAAKEFHNDLFANQPPEGGPYPDLDDLVDRAVDAGVSRPAAQRGIEDAVFEEFVANGTDEAQRVGKIDGTPTVFVDGVEIEDAISEQDLVDKVQAAIEAALAD